MRTLQYIKITMKNLMSNFQISILYFIGLPIIIGMVMGFMNDNMHDTSDVKIDPVKVLIQDEDKSKNSMIFTNFLNSEELKKSIIISGAGEKEYDCTLVIPKGYEESLVTGEKSVIKIEDNNTAVGKLEIVKSVTDSYHIGGYSAQGQTSIEKVKVEKNQVESPYSFYALSMITFVFGMIMLGMINNSIDSKYICLNNRVLSTPNSRFEILNMKGASYFVYTALSILCYCLVYKFAGIAFTGNLLVLIFLVALSSLVMTSVIIFVTTFFGEKYAKGVAMGLFLIPLVGGGVFMPEQNILAKLSPTYFISELFSTFQRGGSITSHSKIIIIIIFVSVVIYLMSALKEMRRGKKNETNLVNMG